MNQHCYTIARLRPIYWLSAIFGLLKVHIAGILIALFLVQDPLLANFQKYIACLISPVPGLSGQTHSHDN